MFKKSRKGAQLDAFASVPSMLDSLAGKQYNDQGHWHNQFREQIVLRIDETIFSVLFNSSTGAPNSPIRILVGMMILKESFGWSDSQLFEQCHFNLLTRSALGLFNINDPLPVQSTYYLMRQRIYNYQKQTGEDLMEKTFVKITRQQIKEFDVNGRSIRMDSKLIGSNIAFFSRYEIIHETLCMFYKSLKSVEKSRLIASDREQLETLLKEESLKTVYNSSREEIKGRLSPMGILIYKMLKLFGELQTEPFQLLQRVFDEQYKVSEEQQIELRPKEEVATSSVQSPNDPDSAYRNKRGNQVKGYSVNITETCSKDNLSLITSVIVDKANIADIAFVEPAIKATCEVTGQKVEKIHVDGAYQGPVNDEFCQGIDMVYTGIHGAKPRFDLEMTTQGLITINTNTGEITNAQLVKKQKNTKEDRWRINTSEGIFYFNQHAIKSAQLRQSIKERPKEELNIRNNVEASIFQYCFTLRNNKSKYRGLIKQKIWSFCRCLWINLIRILNFTKQICQRTFKTPDLLTIEAYFTTYFTIEFRIQPVLSKYFSVVLFLSIVANF